MSCELVYCKQQMVNSRGLWGNRRPDWYFSLVLTPPVSLILSLLSSPLFPSSFLFSLLCLLFLSPLCEDKMFIFPVHFYPKQFTRLLQQMRSANNQGNYKHQNRVGQQHCRRLSTKLIRLSSHPSERDGILSAEALDAMLNTKSRNKNKPEWEMSDLSRDDWAQTLMLRVISACSCFHISEKLCLGFWTFEWCNCSV